MNLICYKSKEIYNGYGSRVKKCKISYSQMCAEMISDVTPTKQFPYYISTEIGKTWYGIPKYIMALDCDTRNGRDLAVMDLVSRDIAFVTIESSPNHYWIITNYVGTIRKVVRLARKISGVDQRFIDCMESHCLCNLRAAPKIINGRAVCPSFMFSYSSNSAYSRWLDAFINHWSSAYIRSMIPLMSQSTQNNANYIDGYDDVVSRPQNPSVVVEPVKTKPKPKGRILLSSLYNNKVLVCRDMAGRIRGYIDNGEFISSIGIINDITEAGVTCGNAVTNMEI